MNIYKRSSGFTLIELLVVMAIIGLLAALSLFSFQGAREQGRDAKRKTDLETIRSALELYKADCNQYPASLGSTITGNCTGTTNTYLQTVPTDPSTDQPYSYSPAGSPPRSYTLCSTLEDSDDTVSGCGSCNPSPCRYKTTNP